MQRQSNQNAICSSEDGQKDNLVLILSPKTGFKYVTEKSKHLSQIGANFPAKHLLPPFVCAGLQIAAVFRPCPITSRCHLAGISCPRLNSEQMPTHHIIVRPSGVHDPLLDRAAEPAVRRNWSRWTILTPPLSSFSVDKTQFLPSMRASLLVGRGEGRPTQGPRPLPPTGT